MIVAILIFVICIFLLQLALIAAYGEMVKSLRDLQHELKNHIFASQLLERASFHKQNET